MNFKNFMLGFLVGIAFLLVISKVTSSYTTGLGLPNNLEYTGTYTGPDFSQITTYTDALNAYNNALSDIKVKSADAVQYAIAANPNLLSTTVFDIVSYWLSVKSDLLKQFTEWKIRNPTLVAANYTVIP